MNPQAEIGGQSILAVHPGALGDVVLFGRLLSRLGGQVTLVAGGQKGGLLHGLGVVSRALDFDALPMHEVFADTPLAECKLPGLFGAHDRLISCFAGGPRGRPVVREPERPVVRELERPALRELEGQKAELRLAGMCGAADAAFLPVRPPEDFQGHLLDLWADLLDPNGACGLPAACGPAARQAGLAEAAAWPVPDAWAQEAHRLLAEIGIDPSRPYALLHPGSGSPAKCWPPARFRALARAITTDLPVAFVIGPVECDRWGEQAARSLCGRFPVLDRPPLPLLAAALAGAKLYVGNDSGVSHLAAGVGAPALTIFGPTNPQHFAPIGPAARTLARQSLAAITAADALQALGDFR